MVALMRPRLYFEGREVDLDNPPPRYQRQRIMAMFEGWRDRVAYLKRAQDSDEVRPSIKRTLAEWLPSWEENHAAELEELEEKHLYMDMTDPNRGRLTSHGIGGWNLRGLDDPKELRRVWEVIDSTDFSLTLMEAFLMTALKMRREGAAPSDDADQSPGTPSSGDSRPTPPDES
jgi:hypothetical protein